MKHPFGQADLEAGFAIFYARLQASAVQKFPELLPVLRDPEYRKLMQIAFGGGAEFMALEIRDRMSEDPRSAPDTKGPTT